MTIISFLLDEGVLVENNAPLGNDISTSEVIVTLTGKHTFRKAYLPHPF
jgi:hypothetical protein